MAPGCCDTLPVASGGRLDVSPPPGDSYNRLHLFSLGVARFPVQVQFLSLLLEVSKEELMAAGAAIRDFKMSVRSDAWWNAIKFPRAR